MKKYKVSVVTPFHNVDMDMFRNCADSMRGQSIGFENIEWVIVVHNCQPHYLPLLQEMFAADPNVRVEELNDGCHSPAMPRNRGMQFVTAPYVGFLDADDSNLFETFPSGCFHEFLPLDDSTGITHFSTDVPTDVPCQLVVTNSAGLYRYVTDHIVRIKETQLDKVLFTIY